MKIKACLFDLDGVIVDTAKYHYLAWKKLAIQMGFDFTLEQNELLKGVSRMKSLDILLEIGGLCFDNKTKLELAEIKNTWYVEYISKMTPSEILPGAKQFLYTLKNNGIKVALGSASKNALAILNCVELTDFFDVIVDGNKVIHTKPDPEVFILGAKELDVSAEACVVFEDAQAGIEAAISAGMHCVGIGDQKSLHRANIVISSLNEMTIERLMF